MTIPYRSPQSLNASLECDLKLRAMHVFHTWKVCGQQKSWCIHLHTSCGWVCTQLSDDFKAGHTNTNGPIHTDAVVRTSYFLTWIDDNLTSSSSIAWSTLTGEVKWSHCSAIAIVSTRCGGTRVDYWKKPLPANKINNVLLSNKEVLLWQCRASRQQFPIDYFDVTGNRT